MELREALSQVAEIRLRMAESELFHGYRALPIAISGVLAIAGGRVQPLVVPAPLQDPRTFVLLWGSIALLSIAIAAATMLTRDCLAGPSQTRALTWIAVRHFLPCLLSGAAVTLAIIRLAPDAAWLLPGLWQLFFAQGIFASSRLLPRAVYFAGGFYFIAGSCNFFIWQGGNAMSPWAMAIPFGLGQFAVAAILYWTLERRHAVETAA